MFAPSHVYAACTPHNGPAIQQNSLTTVPPHQSNRRSIRPHYLGANREVLVSEHTHQPVPSVLLTLAWLLYQLNAVQREQVCYNSHKLNLAELLPGTHARAKNPAHEQRAVGWRRQCFFAVRANLHESFGVEVFGVSAPAWRKMDAVEMRRDPLQILVSYLFLFKHPWVFFEGVFGGMIKQR